MVGLERHYRRPVARSRERETGERETGERDDVRHGEGAGRHRQASAGAGATWKYGSSTRTDVMCPTGSPFSAAVRRMASGDGAS